MTEAAAEAEEKPVVRSGGIPLKLVILIAGGTLLLGLAGFRHAKKKAAQVGCVLARCIKGT